MSAIDSRTLRTAPDAVGRTRVTRPARRGFTLIELLVVMTIMVILTGLTVAATRWAMQWAELRRARTEMSTMLTEFAEWMVKTGGYGDSVAAGSISLRQVNREARLEFDDKAFTDPWGNDYALAYRNGWEIRSAGPDGAWGTPDDLVVR